MSLKNPTPAPKFSRGLRLPDDTQRLAIIGRTGSGKTQAAGWHLSRRSWDKIPWVIFDYKGDKLISEIPKLKQIDHTKSSPTKAGLFVVRPTPDENESVEQFLWSIHKNENTGVYIDEGYMIGNSPAFRALLTQGRSKNIPMIVLSQRPVWLSRFVWSESDFYQVFHLNSISDKKSVKDYLHPGIDVARQLDNYWSWYHDVGLHAYALLRPVPSHDTILNIFSERQRLRRKPL